MELFKGALIAGRYLAEDKVGEGSFGAVWSGKHTGLGAKVALKTLLPAAAADEESVTRFHREARFLARIQSDHVARVLDFIQDPTFGLVLVMEFVEGELLFETMRGRRMAVEESIAIGIDVLRGLCDLHAAHVIHRDLKPGNVILRPMRDGSHRAIIFDFSLSRTTPDGPKEEDSAVTDLTQRGVAVGTLPYMAPEQILNSREVTERSDLYSLGAVLYRMVAGRHLFNEAGGDLMRTKLTKQPPRLDTGRVDALAHGFEEIVLKAVQRKPVDRFASAEQMLAQMLALDGGARSADDRQHHTQTNLSVFDLDADGAADAPTGRMERGAAFLSSDARDSHGARDSRDGRDAHNGRDARDGRDAHDEPELRGAGDGASSGLVLRPVHFAAAFAILCVGMAGGSAFTRHRLTDAIALASASASAARQASLAPASSAVAITVAPPPPSAFDAPVLPPAQAHDVTDDAAVAAAPATRAAGAAASPMATQTTQTTAAVARRGAASAPAATALVSPRASNSAPTSVSTSTPTSRPIVVDAGAAAPNPSPRSPTPPTTNGTDNPY